MYVRHPTYGGCPNISGSIQTCGGVQAYRGHPNIWGIQTYEGCPYIWGHPKIW